MIIEGISATRMNLLQLRRRLTTAIKGHKLLKDKQDELMRRFLELIENIKEKRKLVQESMANVMNRFLMSYMQIPKKNIDVSLSFPQESLQIKETPGYIMNLKTFDLEIVKSGDIRSYSLLDTNSDFDICIIALNELFNELVALTQLEKKLIMLSYEIEKTRRRVNALEHKLIPNIEDTIKMINFKLDERERSNMTRLLKIKDMMKNKSGI